MSSTAQKSGRHTQSILIAVNIIIVVLLFSACGQVVSSGTVLSGHLLIEGSTALQPLTSQAASLFKKSYPQVDIQVSGGGSLLGLDAVTKAKADIGESDVYADPALYPDPNLTDHIVCIVPFTMIANPDVPLSTLTQQQISEIFVTGTVRNWAQLGGPDLPIVPIIRSDTSGTRASFLKYVLNGISEHPQVHQADSSQMMLQLVAQLPGAIGYVGLPSLAKTVHPLAMNGVPATQETIASGQYAFWGYEHMYTMSSNRNPLLAIFLQFMLTTQIQQEAMHMGYIPLVQIPFPSSSSQPGAIATAAYP